ncbi:MAG: hypothetical protein ACJ8G1_27775 [Vitreoscilla sp.]
MGRPVFALLPAFAALAYPFWLLGAHVMAGMAMLLLPGAFAMPLLAAACWWRLAQRPTCSVFERRARLLALLACAAPPLYVFIAFALRVLGNPVPELLAWPLAWAVAAAWTCTGSPATPVAPGPPVATAARVAHGLVAALVLAFVAFHLANHLVGLLGPQSHAAVMRIGRMLYRRPAVEATLLLLLVLQVALGAGLAWRWGARSMDGYRGVQVATGVYLGFFVLAHMNSALVSARLLNGVDTDWAWASNAPVGLLKDAWSIRLLPHYALGVFCALAHLACGLRAVLLGHGVPPAVADRAWRAGLASAAVVAALIVSALCGVRLDA